MHITAQGPRLRNDLYCVQWDVKLYYTIPYHPTTLSDFEWFGNESNVSCESLKLRPYRLT